eukprot:182648_1
MCILPNPQGDIPASPRALQLAKILKVVLVINMVLAPFVLVSGLVYPGIISLVMAALAFYAIHTEIHKIQIVMCFTLFSGYLALVTLVAYIVFLVRQGELATEDNEHLDGFYLWNFYVAVLLALCVYVINVYLGKQLYDELRTIFVPMDPSQQGFSDLGMMGMGASNSMFGGSGGTQAQAAYGSRPPADLEAQTGRNTQPDTGFKPFQGEGYRLS